MMYANEIVNAARTETLKSMTMRRQEDGVRLLLHKAYELKGVEPLETDVNHMASDIITEVGNRYRTMTVGEIALALKYGILENFGKDTRITSGNCLLWIERYMTSNERTAAVTAAKHAQTAETSRLLISPEERERRHAEFLATAPRKEWLRYKAAGGRLEIRVDGYAAAVWDALVELGKIRVSEETMARARAKAVQELRSEYIAREGILGSALITAFGGREDYRAKRLLLGGYFKKLMDEGREYDA